jgi:hypothetical protein
MTLSMNDFVAELRQMVAHWNKELTLLDGGNPLVGQIAAWLVEAERIIDAHDEREA